MNEKEKKAIGLLKALNNLEKKCKIEKVPYNKSEIKKIMISLLPEDYGIFEILLNLIEKLQKENEELLQEKINNQKIIALAQNDMLNYQAGFEDGKNRRTSAVQSIIENQQYYIFQKQFEKYEEHIKMLQKENEELKKFHIQDNKHLDFIMQHSIPVQEVKDKIEELKQEKKKYGNCLIEMYEDELVNRDIKILQELLEGRK